MKNSTKGRAKRKTPTAASRKARNRDRSILRQRKRSINRKLENAKKIAAPRATPVFTSGSINYEMSGKASAIDCGGLGAIHALALNSGLVKAIDSSVHVLKKHLPYHESDHVLNIAYNVMSGGTCLDDIELRRNDETYMTALGTDRIPDPTTAGDFSRRFEVEDVHSLMDAINSIRPNFWKMGLAKEERDLAILEVDGSICRTLGECKEGMDISYKGVWGYHPLIVSLRNTQEVLFLENRPGNRPSHEGFAKWVDRGIELLKGTFARVMICGDTDFSSTKDFDRWTQGGVLFVFGYDAHRSLIARAQALSYSTWSRLDRRVKRTRKTKERSKPENVKQRIVEERGYKTIKLEDEHIAEFEYKPGACKRTYRMIVVRKTLSVKQGQMRLEDDIRYFFYVTNVPETELSASQVVFHANDRCNQENLIEQLKYGLNALRAPVGDLVSNWAYMVMASLPWSLKAWFALSARFKKKRSQILRMEFRTFVNRMIRIPAQILRSGRRIVWRLLGYNDWLPTFFSTFDRIRQLRFSPT